MRSHTVQSSTYQAFFSRIRSAKDLACLCWAGSFDPGVIGGLGRPRGLWELPESRETLNQTLGPLGTGGGWIQSSWYAKALPLQSPQLSPDHITIASSLLCRGKQTPRTPSSLLRDIATSAYSKEGEINIVNGRRTVSTWPSFRPELLFSEPSHSLALTVEAPHNHYSPSRCPSF